MNLRLYRPADRSALLALFYDTIHTVCAADYTSAQLDAWAPREPDLAAWDEIFRGRTTLVAGENGTPLGFGSIGTDGYLDLLYVYKACQRRGQVLTNYVMEKELI